MELYFQHAPRTCHNIAELARSGYYDGTIFHRIIKVRLHGMGGLNKAAVLPIRPSILASFLSVCIS